MIFVTSGSARNVGMHAVVYAATKHAVSAFAKGFRLELKSANVRVTELAPGMVDTDMRKGITHPEVLKALAARGTVLDAPIEARLRQAMPLLQDRGKTVLELADQMAFVIAQRPLVLDDKATTSLTEETVARLSRLRDRLRMTPVWSAPELEALLKDFAEQEAVGFGKFGPALRAILTAGLPAPDLGKTLAALNRDESLTRIDDRLL
jgi:glutamyl/glutaminyl-tRNA synthetase